MAESEKNELKQAIDDMNALPNIDGEDSSRLRELIRVTTREVKAVGGASAGTTLEMIGYIRELERTKTQSEDSYVAWCRYTYDESGGIRSIVTCDSDAKGAFKVYASPSDAEQLIELRKLAQTSLDLLNDVYNSRASQRFSAIGLSRIQSHIKELSELLNPLPAGKETE